MSSEVDEGPPSGPAGSGRALRVVVFSAFFPPAFQGGGPARTLGAMVSHLPEGIAAAVMTSDTDLGSQVALDVDRDAWVVYGDAQVRYISAGSAASWWKAIIAVRAFGPDVVYLNSFFDARFSILPQLLARMRALGRVAVVLAPRGEFGSGALAQRSGKKRAYVRIFTMLRLNRGVTWHASTPREEADIVRVMGTDAKVVVRWNDTALPPVADAAPTRSDGPLRAVHAARLVPTKGLDRLLIALLKVSTPLSLDIFGPVEDPRFVGHCERLADSLPEHIAVNFRGPLHHASVRTVVRAYDVALYPTLGENFGHSIAEALSVACPVMCADTTPWTSYLRNGGGVVVTPDTPDGWGRAVQDYAIQDSDELTRRREGAAAAYRAWQLEVSRQPHLFTKLAMAGIKD